MKLAWYTPFSERSAIGKYSEEVINALIELGHRVTLVRSESDVTGSPARRQLNQVELVSASDIDADAEVFLADFDCVLYNVGNHFPNHAYALEHQRRVPGVTLLHDFCLHHLLSGWAVSTQRQTYVDVLENEAGAEAAKIYCGTPESALQRDWFMRAAVEFPVVRFAMPNTLGVVTHADFYREAVGERCCCPTTTIPLAYPCESESRLPPPRLDTVPMRLLTIGDVNINKRFESIIRAIGSCPKLSRTWQYRIVGSVSSDYERHLQQLARTTQHPVDIALLGSVDDDVVESELKAANALACLRFPIIEGASASVIVCLASGRPTFVSEGGCYSEIPAEFVYSVPHENEIAQFCDHMRSITSDYATAVDRAASARQWALARHCGRNYATQLLEFIESALHDQPMIKLADRIAGHLSNWGCATETQIHVRAEKAAVELFESDLLRRNV